MSYKSDEDFARETGPVWRFLRGMIRRVEITIASATTKWQVRGVRSRSGGDEVFDAELFPGIGIFARPPTSSSTEAVIVSVGGSKVAIAVATRDVATLRLVASQVGDGETAIYTAGGLLLIRANGQMELRSLGGVALRLPKLSELAAMINGFNNHKHADPSSGFTGPPLTAGGAANNVAAATGTTIVSAE